MDDENKFDGIFKDLMIGFLIFAAMISVLVGLGFAFEKADAAKVGSLDLCSSSVPVEFVNRKPKVAKRKITVRVESIRAGSVSIERIKYALPPRSEVKVWVTHPHQTKMTIKFKGEVIYSAVHTAAVRCIR